MTAEAEDRGIVRIERAIPAPPHRVCRAWLDPELVRPWLAPGRQEVTRVEIDDRPGVGLPDLERRGRRDRRRLRLRTAGTGPRPQAGLPLWLRRPAAQARPVRRHAPDRQLPPRTSGATTVKLAHDRLYDLAAAMPAIAVNVGPGWEAVLANLDKTLPSGG
jgi:hypothetical protein